MLPSAITPILEKALSLAPHVIVGGVVYLVYEYGVVPLFYSPMFLLPGPELKTFSFFPGTLEGSELEAVGKSHIPGKADEHDELVKLYGKTFRIYGVTLRDIRFFTLDPRAMSFVLNNPALFPKPWQSQKIISELIGNGLFASEGPSNRRQRKVINPAFSTQNINSLIPIFLKKAQELHDVWFALVQAQPSGKVVQNVASWVSRATFDIIGLTGFDYAFEALSGEENEVYKAYTEMFDVGMNQGLSMWMLAGALFPALKTLFPDKRSQTIEKSHKIIYRTGKELLDRKKAEILSGETQSGHKDLLTLLIRSNLSKDIPADQRISDSDILDQINSFFFAGSDSTSLAIAWALYLLSTHPAIQTRLREEVRSIPYDRDEPHSFDFGKVDALPLLDKVCKEELRLIPPVHSSLRAAAEDTVIPLSEPLRGTDGQLRSEIRVPKGTFIHVPIEGFNLLTEVWGPDAKEFNPDRWDHLPEAVKLQPGLYSNLLSFSAGPRSCIGQRFSIIEMKTILFILLRTFEFSDGGKIFKVTFVMTRPYVAGEKKTQLPLTIRAVNLPP